DSGLERFEQTRFFVDVAATGLLGALPEPFHLSPAEVALEEGRRYDRDQELGLWKVLQQFTLHSRCNGILRQARDADFFTQTLPPPPCGVPLQWPPPPRLTRRERVVVNCCIVQEHVAVFQLLQRKWLDCDSSTLSRGGLQTTPNGGQELSQVVRHRLRRG